MYGEFSKEYLDKTIRNALNIIQHMSHTIDDFRDFFKQEKEKQAFSLRGSRGTLAFLYRIQSALPQYRR